MIARKAGDLRKLEDMGFANGTGSSRKVAPALAKNPIRARMGVNWTGTMLLIRVLCRPSNDQFAAFVDSINLGALDSIPLDKGQPPPYTLPRSVHAIQQARLNSGTKVGLIWRSVRCKVPDPRD
jgi:hypothetical protein